MELQDKAMTIATVPTTNRTAMIHWLLGCTGRKLGTQAEDVESCRPGHRGNESD